MQIQEVQANYRHGIGSNYARRCRNNGLVPAVIYDSFSNKVIELDKREIEMILKQYGNHAIVNLQVGPENIKSMIMEVQHDPVNHQIIHVDFKPVTENMRVRTSIPIRFIGAANIERSGAIIQKQRQELEIECLVDRVPKYIDVDLSQLSAGHSFKVQDVEIAEDLTIMTKPEEVLATITTSSNRTEEQTTEKPSNETDDKERDGNEQNNEE